MQFSVKDLKVFSVILLAGVLAALPGAPAAAQNGFVATLAQAGNNVIDATCGPRNPFGNGVVCIQEYALCISALCKEAAGSGPGGKPMAQCNCDVIRGASIGQGTCAERAPGQGTNGQKTLVSTYSFQQTLPAFKLMSCPPEMNGKTLRYADCYNMPCTVDPAKPTKAVCTCPILEARGGTFITRGGHCDVSTCTQIWSGAPTLANNLVNWQFACDLGMPQPPDPQACPAE